MEQLETIKHRVIHQVQSGLRWKDSKDVIVSQSPKNVLIYSPDAIDIYSAKGEEFEGAQSV